MTLEEIVDRLRKMDRLKAQQSEVRGEFVKELVAMGMAQDKALKIDVYQFFDGYLFALGYMQEWREK